MRPLEIFNYVMENKDHKLSRDKEFNFPNFPPNYRLVGSIEDFRDNGGQTIFEAAKYKDVEFCLINAQDLLLRHPLTGGTIAHHYYPFFDSLPIDDRLRSNVVSVKDFQERDAAICYAQTHPEYLEAKVSEALFRIRENRNGQ